MDVALVSGPDQKLSLLQSCCHLPAVQLLFLLAIGSKAWTHGLNKPIFDNTSCCCRMGRMLIRMVSSNQLATGTTMLPFITLIIATVQEPCPSCQPNYMLLGLIVSYTILLGLGSVLLHPKSSSNDDDILMQVSTAAICWLVVEVVCVSGACQV